MRAIGFILVLALLVTGCATRSTVETRKQERATAYAALTPEQRALVDQGQIKVGLPEDAVYIAWGPPSQVAHGESPTGTTKKWIYSGTGWQEHHYWNYRPYYYGYGHGRYGYVHPLPTLDYEYVPYRYTAAEVEFENGKVKSWRHITPPPH
jgi:hypothetical protein